MSTLRPAWALGISAVAGAAGWLAIAEVADRREAWDSELYFSVFLPAIACIVAALGFFAPERAWRWAFAPFGAQAVVAVVQNPGANLLPIGLIVFAVYGAVCLVPARAGVALRRRLERGRSPRSAASR